MERVGGANSTASTASAGSSTHNDKGAQGAGAGAGALVDPAKYQRLAQEYSKLRSHVHVLKKGLLDEQRKWAELKELLKERDKNIRKGELEIDSLNFRNQQLTKRITVLQDELDVLQQKNTKKGKSKSESNAQSSSQASTSYADSSVNVVMQEELQKKIIENASLFSQIAVKDFTISQMNLRLEDAEKQLSEIDTKYKCEMLKLKAQNNDLSQSLDNATRDKSGLHPHGIPFKHHNQPPSINGDFLSEAGSLIGSEDALSAEESHFNEQIVKKNSTISKLEQEIQNLKIDCDLLRIENENIKSKLSTDDATVKEPKDSLTTTNILGELTDPFVVPADVVEREEKLKKYFRDKISSLIVEKQYCESTTRHFTHENDTLNTRLEFIQKEKSDLEQLLVSLQTTISRLEDELHSTSSNYEQQLSLLTEHVGNLNDKLSQQFEEIMMLKGKQKSKK